MLCVCAVPVAAAAFSGAATPTPLQSTQMIPAGEEEGEHLFSRENRAICNAHMIMSKTI